MPVVKLCARCSAYATHGRYCQQHARERQQQQNQRDHSYGYSSTHWRRMRQLARHYHPHCQRCGSTTGLTVHLDPALHGDHRSAQLDDCTVLCASCHGTLDAPRASRAHL